MMKGYQKCGEQDGIVSNVVGEEADNGTCLRPLFALLAEAAVAFWFSLFIKDLIGVMCET